MAPVSIPLHQLLYVSMLSSDTPLTVIGDIARKSRVTNETCGVTGVLVFDGLRFCEYLEGDESGVLSLMARMRGDPRHTEICVLHEGSCAERLFNRFSIGYTMSDDEGLDSLSNLSGLAALAAFQQLVPHLDLDH